MAEESTQRRAANFMLGRDLEKASIVASCLTVYDEAARRILWIINLLR